MAAKATLAAIVFCSWLLFLVTAKLFTIEVENFAPKAMRRPRSSASGEFSVLLLERHSLKLDFCLRDQSEVHIRDIVYSNDGLEDKVRTYIDGVPSGSFISPLREDNGNGWNSFSSTGPLSESVSLRTGRHTVLINVTQADNWGIEIDYILLDISDHRLDYSDLMCHLFCFDNIKYDDVPRKDSIPSGRFVQRSVMTQCAEQDNIHVDIFHETAQDFEIIANLPKYVSFANNRDPRYDNCHIGSPYWIFQNVSIYPGQTIDEPYSKLQLTGSQSHTSILARFNFDSLTESRELDESVLGSVLTLRLRNLPRQNVQIMPEYMKNGAWRSMPKKLFTPFNVEQSWNIPDRSWNTEGENVIRMVVRPGQQTVVIDTMSLSKRSVSDTVFEMYADMDIVVEGVRLGFWHHWDDQPTSMTVSIAEETHRKVDSIRIYSKVPWTGGYSQTFVLFQDGRVRLQAKSPHGLDYVPFGSSVFIGQPKNPSDSRPYAPIKSIFIDTSKVRMLVEYIDGNKAVFLLKSSNTNTRLLVTKAIFRKDRRQYPMMSFKSMWINDGNSNVDHITLNGGISRHVMSGWRELYGISSVFYRTCISSHNTQAPDLTIQFLSPSDV